jgi:alpha-glucosidase
MLSLYRAALHRRSTEASLGDGEMAWLPSADDVLAFSRGEDFACVVNLSGAAVRLPAHEELLIASGPLDGGLLPPDTAAWLRV